MNKKLIAIAIAGAMAAPMAAQAEVSISGLIQTEVVSVSGDGADAAGTDGLDVVDGMENSAVNSGNGSGLFFNVAEDLGGGMKAVGKVGLNFWPADNGSKGIGARDAYAGIAGGFGTVLAGRMNSPYKASTVKWDPFLTTFMQARGSNGMSGLQNGYAEDALAYANNFGNIKVVAAYVIDDSAVEEDGMSFSVNMPAGPVEVAVAYIAAPGVASDNTGTKVGVKWNSGAITVAGQYEMMDAAVGNGDQLYVNAGYQMGNNLVSLGFGSFSVDDDSAAAAAAGFPTADADYLALGVKHTMSKKVGLHAGYRSSGPDGGETSVIGAGLRVKF